MTGIVDFRTELLGETGAPITASNPLPTTGGGGGVVEVTDPIAELILTRMLNYLNSPMGYDKSLQRSRVTAVLESGTVTTVSTVTTVTTVSTVANMTSIGGIQGQIGVYGQNLAAWANCVRARIT
jgi:hypothetical protein